MTLASRSHCSNSASRVGTGVGLSGLSEDISVAAYDESDKKRRCEGTGDEASEMSIDCLQACQMWKVGKF